MRLLFVGPPGAGKGTQAHLVASRLGIPHVSTGEMFRQHVESGTAIGAEVRVILETGEYVPDSLTVAMLEERVGRLDAADGFILDGFPRTAAQVLALDGLIGATGLDRVVVFEVDEDILAERMLTRGRPDDTHETIRNRFKIYAEQTEPLLDLYRARGVVVEVDGMGPVDEVTERVLASL